MKHLSFIVAMMLALLTTSCSLTRSADKTTDTTLTHRDSTSYSKEITIDTVRVAKRSDSMKVLLNDLLEKGEFKQRYNGVQTIIRYKDDTVSAECICDEVEKYVTSTMEKYFKTHQKDREFIQKEKIKKVVTKTDWTAILILSGIILVLILFIYLKTTYGK